MANHKSAKKRARQDIKKTEVNGRVKNAVRTYEKKLSKALDKKDAGLAKEALKTYESQMGKAASKGVFHAKTAARKISRLASKVARLGK